jgi:hypothetical protein
MRDSEYILDEVIRLLKTNLDVVESNLISGNIINIEDYKYNLGIRRGLHVLQEHISELTRGN